MKGRRGVSDATKETARSTSGTFLCKGTHHGSCVDTRIHGELPGHSRMGTSFVFVMGRLWLFHEFRQNTSTFREWLHLRQRYERHGARCHQEPEHHPLPPPGNKADEGDEEGQLRYPACGYATESHGRCKSVSVFPSYKDFCTQLQAEPKLGHP